MVEKNKLTDIKKREQERRTELAMLGLLIEKYPREAKEKTRKLVSNESKKPLNNMPLKEFRKPVRPGDHL